MADREIKTRIVLEGEKQYKQALADINRQLRESKSAVSAAAAEYQAAEASERTTAEQTGALNEMLERQREKLALMQAELKRVEVEYGANSREAVTLRTSINTTRAEMAKTQTQLRGLTDGLQAAGDAGSSLGEGMEGTAAGLDRIGGSAQEAAGDVRTLLGEIGQTVGQKVLEFSIGKTALDAMKLAIGEAIDAQAEHAWMLANAGSAELAAARDAAQEILDRIWAGRMDGTQTAAAVTAVDTAMGNMSLSDMQGLVDITSRMIGMQEAGWQSVGEGVTRAKTLMNAFGVSAEDALDMMTRGFQDSADGGELMTQALDKGSNLFKQLGFDAQSMIGTLVAISQDTELGKNGNLVTGMEAFLTTVTSGSKEAQETLKALGIEVTDLPGKLSEGGETAARATQMILRNLTAIDDAAERDALGRSLFGDKAWADSGGQIATALLDGFSRTIQAADASADVVTALTDNLSDAGAGAAERMKQLGGEFGAPIADGLKESLQAFNEGFDEGGLLSGLWEGLKTGVTSLPQDFGQGLRQIVTTAIDGSTEGAATQFFDGLQSGLDAAIGQLETASQQASERFFEGAQEPDQASADAAGQRWIDVMRGSVTAAAQESADEATASALLESMTPQEAMLTERMRAYAQSHRAAVVAQMTEVYGQDASDEDFQAWQQFQQALIDSAYDDTVQGADKLGGDAADAAVSAVVSKWEDARGAGREFGVSGVEGAEDALEDMEDAGRHGASSAVSGLRTGIGPAYRAGWDTGSRYNQGFRDALQIRSPSRVMRASAREATDGLTLELAEREREIYARGAAIAQAFAGGYAEGERARSTAAPAPAVDAESIGAAVRDALGELEIVIDGERVGVLVSGGVSRAIAQKSAQTASGRGAQVRSW